MIIRSLVVHTLTLILSLAAYGGSSADLGQNDANVVADLQSQPGAEARVALTAGSAAP